jgi:hypothetical protein
MKDDVDGMLGLLRGFSRTLSEHQIVLFRCALSQFLPFDTLGKNDICKTKGEFDYAKYDPKVKERLEEGELPSSGGAYVIISEAAVNSVKTFLEEFSSPYQKKQHQSLYFFDKSR